jgi:GxxExxY protein
LCLCYELRERHIAYVSEPTLAVKYKGLVIPNAYRPDLIVGNDVIVELKHVEKVLSVHEAQLRTYLKLSGFRTGLLLNFNSTVLKNGIRRLSITNASHVPPTPTSPSHP